jgi:hypothetical protein
MSHPPLRHPLRPVRHLLLHRAAEEPEALARTGRDPGRAGDPRHAPAAAGPGRRVRAHRPAGNSSSTTSRPCPPPTSPPTSASPSVAPAPASTPSPRRWTTWRPTRTRACG